MITDEMVEKAQTEYERAYHEHADTPEGHRAMMRDALTAALGDAVVVLDDKPVYEVCAAKMAADFQYRSDGHFREDVIAACVRTMKHATRWRDPYTVTRHEEKSHD